MGRGVGHIASPIVYVCTWSLGATSIYHNKRLNLNTVSPTPVFRGIQKNYVTLEVFPFGRLNLTVEAEWSKAYRGACTVLVSPQFTASL